MSTPIRERVLTRNFILCAIALASIVGLHVLKMDEANKYIIDLLVVIVLLALGIFLELLVLPSRFRQKNLVEMMVGAQHAAEKSMALELVLEQIMEDLAQRLDRVRVGVYVCEDDSIPDLSLSTVKAVEHSAFATFVAGEGEKLYQSEKGQAYLQAWYEKADALKEARQKRLKKERGTFHRLLILDGFERTNDSIVELILSHQEHGVGVTVIERKKAEELARQADLALDFGLYDDKCLMTVEPAQGALNTLSVYVHVPAGENAQTLNQYKQFRDQLMGKDTSAEDFLHAFRKPLNAEYWNYRFKEHGPVLGPPHGLSGWDAKAMVSFVVEHIEDRSRHLRVAVLGLTPELIKACAEEKRIYEIVLIDQTNVEVEIPVLGKKIYRESANWLTFERKGQYDAILGDESLNNLSVRQYRGFFRAMRSSLASGGILIMRTLGRFGDGEDFLTMPAQKMLEHVKAATAEETEVHRAARIIEFLHSREIAFEEDQELIDTKRYNGHLKTWQKQRLLTAEQAGRYWFPEANCPALKLTSPLPSRIDEACIGYFRQGTVKHVDPSYRSGHHSLGVFYRITPFFREG